MNNIVANALRIATDAHHGVFRKYTGRPYIEHPIRVAFAGMYHLRSHPQIEEIAAGFLCHDVDEDNPDYPTERLLREGLPEYSVNIVRQLTNPSKRFPNLSRAERKKMDREHLMSVDWVAKVGKLLDREDNLNEMQGAPTDFIALYCNESTDLVKAILSNVHENDSVLPLLGANVFKTIRNYGFENV